MELGQYDCVTAVSVTRNKEMVMSGQEKNVRMNA
jgi:hypothetical protein